VSAIEFTWDPAKERANAKKHGVQFDEAQSAFSDEHARVIDDPEHSADENRFILLGMSTALRLLVVVHAHREPDARIRIISARKATARERHSYSQKARS
jgi:uncharacterized DUF497 family protein